MDVTKGGILIGSTKFRGQGVNDRENKKRKRCREVSRKRTFHLEK